MLRSMKSSAFEEDKSAAEVMAVQPHDQARATTKPGTATCIGSGMSIVGNVECDGPAQVFGRIKGELRGSDRLIGDCAHIDGSVVAQAVTAWGRVKGHSRAVTVKLQNGGGVEGDIFHRSLSIDENSLFEGSPRRVENPTSPPPVGAKGPQEQDRQSSPLASYMQRVEAS